MCEADAIRQQTVNLTNLFLVIDSVTNLITCATRDYESDKIDNRQLYSAVGRGL